MNKSEPPAVAGRLNTKNDQVETGIGTELGFNHPLPQGGSDLLDVRILILFPNDAKKVTRTIPRDFFLIYIEFKTLCFRVFGFFFFLAFDAADLDEIVALDLVFVHHHLLIEFTHHLHFFGGGFRTFHFRFVGTR